MRWTSEKNRWYFSDSDEKEHEKDWEETSEGVWRIRVAQTLMEL